MSLGRFGRRGWSPSENAEFNRIPRWNNRAWFRLVSFFGLVSFVPKASTEKA